MKTLNLKKALELYDLLGEYLPDNLEDYEIVDLVSSIITNIAEDNSDAFARSIMLMAGFDADKVSKISTAELIKIFTSGILVNNIVELNKFCKEIRYA